MKGEYTCTRRYTHCMDYSLFHSSLVIAKILCLGELGLGKAGSIYYLFILREVDKRIKTINNLLNCSLIVLKIAS